MRIRGSLTVLAPIALLAAGACGEPGTRESPRTAELRGRVLAEPVAMPDAVLVDTSGEPYDLRAETEGRTTLLFFGYTHCPDVCPIHMANIAAVLDDLGAPVRDRLDVVFVTTDPERDTPERLDAWLARFDPDFVGLTGPAGAVEEMQRALNLTPSFRQEIDEGEYLVAHASQVVAFGPDGVARVVYPFGVRQVDWTHDLPILVGLEPGSGRETPETSAAAPGSGPIALSPAVVAEPVSPDGTALYLRIDNAAPLADTLLGISTPVAARVEIHRTVERGAMRRMEPLAALPIPAGGRAVLEPGASHGMLVDPVGELAPGDRVPLTLLFRNAGEVRVDAAVVRYEDLEAALDGAPPAGGPEE